MPDAGARVPDSRRRAGDPRDAGSPQPPRDGVPSDARSAPRGVRGGTALERARDRTAVVPTALQFPPDAWSGADRRRPDPGGESRGCEAAGRAGRAHRRSEEHTSELQSQSNLVCRLLLEKKKSLLPLMLTGDVWRYLSQ